MRKTLLPGHISLLLNCSEKKNNRNGHENISTIIPRQKYSKKAHIKSKMIRNQNQENF